MSVTLTHSRSLWCLFSQQQRLRLSQSRDGPACARPSSACIKVLLSADLPRSEHHTTAGRNDTRTDQAAVAIVVSVGVIAPAIVTIIRKSRAYAHTNRTKLHARTAGVRAYKHLRASWCRNDEYKGGNQPEYKFIHNILQYIFDLALQFNARRAPFVQRFSSLAKVFNIAHFASPYRDDKTLDYPRIKAHRACKSTPMKASLAIAPPFLEN